MSAEEIADLLAALDALRAELAKPRGFRVWREDGLPPEIRERLTNDEPPKWTYSGSFQIMTICSG